jgi:hypothetical protein
MEGSDHGVIRVMSRNFSEGFEEIHEKVKIVCYPAETRTWPFQIQVRYVSARVTKQL